MASSVVSVRVPERVKRVLDEKGVDYRGVVRAVLEALADALSGEARKRLEEAFAMADSLATGVEVDHEELIRAIRCPGGSP